MIIAGLLSLPAQAGDDDKRHEEYMKRVREKEVGRANEAAKDLGDMEDLEKRYGWLKENHGDKYDEYKEKRKVAAQDWREVAKRIGRAKNTEEVDVIKMSAYKSNAIAELARLELRAAGSEANWLKSAEKTDSGAAKRAARALIDNQRSMIEVTKQKLISEQRLRELSIERQKLEGEMRDEYEKSREKERNDRKPNKGSDDRRVEKKEPERKVGKPREERPKGGDEPKREEKPWEPGGVIE